MSDIIQLVVFRLDGQCYALPLGTVERIVRAVEVTTLPGAPLVVSGVIDVAGRILPVVDLRRRFGLPPREPNVMDHFLVARTNRRSVVLPVDEAQGVIERQASELVPGAGLAAGLAQPRLDQIEGVIRSDDGLVLIHDLESLLSRNEESALDEALTQEAAYAT